MWSLWTNHAFLNSLRSDTQLHDATRDAKANTTQDKGVCHLVWALLEAQVDSWARIGPGRPLVAMASYTFQGRPCRLMAGQLPAATSASISPQRAVGRRS